MLRDGGKLDYVLGLAYRLGLTHVTARLHHLLAKDKLRSCYCCVEGIGVYGHVIESSISTIQYATVDGGRSTRWVFDD